MRSVTEETLLASTRSSAAGLGIRESAGPVTDEYARFLPHVIR
ncbi:hypothetical protein ACPCUV_12370 [Streptomyces platensis]